MRFLVRLGFAGLFCAFVSSVYADAALLQRKDVQQFVNVLVKDYHFDRKQVSATLREANFQPQIIESMEKPYEKKSWDMYKGLFLTKERVQSGIQYWQSNQKALARAEKEFGVPAPIIVAIIGVETLYGKHQGNYRVLDALTTLAFDYPKRSDFFAKELREYLLLCREHHVPATQYMGSYAGAMGKPQFMPSSYRFYAVDFTGKGTRDLINNDQDVIGSVANYFHKHGWKLDSGIAEPAKVRGLRYKKLATNSKFANYDVRRLFASGVSPMAGKVSHSGRAGLIELSTDKGEEYWLAYPNFYVITHYNTSPQYALVVFLLAKQLQQQWALLSKHSNRLYV